MQYTAILQLQQLQFSVEKRDNYASNFEEVEDAYWFGPVRLSVDLFVDLSVRLSVTLALSQEPLEIGS